MDFADWLSTRLARHPLKAPSDVERRRFTAQVMARVRAETSPRRAPSASPLLWGFWPRLGVSLAAAAAVLAVVGRLHLAGSNQRLAAQLARESELLAELDEPASAWTSAPDDVDSLAEELEYRDMLVLAEAPPSGDTWVADTLQLLDQLDEELPDDAATPNDANTTEDDWLNELQMLDDSELAARS